MDVNSGSVNDVSTIAFIVKDFWSCINDNMIHGLSAGGGGGFIVFMQCLTMESAGLVFLNL